MTTDSKRVTRQDLEARLSSIEARMATRRDDIADIESRQLAAATAGEPPDQALATAKGVLLDAAGIDERAAAAMRGALDQVLADEQRARDLTELARLGSETAAVARKAEREGETWAAAWADAHEAVKGAVAGLIDQYAAVVDADRHATLLADAAQELAQRLGEPAPGGVVSQAGRLSRVIPRLREGALQNDLTWSAGRLFQAVQHGNQREAAKQLAMAALVEWDRHATRADVR